MSPASTSLLFLFFILALQYVKAHPCGYTPIKPHILTNNHSASEGDSRPYSWPWTALLCIQLEKEGTPLECPEPATATIVGRRWVLTHFNVVTYDKKQFRVKLGIYNLSR
jgi:hypothetical protein